MLTSIGIDMYHITPKGLLDPEWSDKLLLHMIKTGENALIWDGKELIFETVAYFPDKKKRKKPCQKKR